ncbi:MAG: serine protease [Chlamydiia bacterium]|nr:serine protease [Chlamydiia bacterium]
MISSILAIIGLLLIFIEFFVPGGILGVTGGILLVGSVILFALQTESFLAFILFFVIVIVILGVLIKFALWRKKKKKGIYLSNDQEGYSASSYDKEMIGKEAKTLSDLKPSGHIVVEGKRLQAVSKTGYVDKGIKVMVIGGQGAHLIVKKMEGK